MYNIKVSILIIQGQRFKLRYDGMIHILEVPKAREYDSGVIRVVAKNPFGEAEYSTSLTVVARDDWRSRLKQAPRCKYLQHGVLINIEHCEGRRITPLSESLKIWIRGSIGGAFMGLNSWNVVLFMEDIPWHFWSPDKFSVKFLGEKYHF